MTIDALFGSRVAEVLPDAITPALAAELRARVEPRYQRYTLVDRGSYEHADLDEPALFGRLVERVAKRASVSHVVSARVLRFSCGDYLLAHADRVYEGNPIELVIDLSASPVPGAEVHYRRRGAVFFRVPSAPCSMAIVERGPTVTCNHTYVSKRHAGASVVRLVALVR